MNESTVFLLAVMWPMALATALGFKATQTAALKLAPWAALPALILSLFAGSEASQQLPWLLLGTELGLVGDTDRMFLQFTALLWWLAGMFAQTYLANQPKRGQFFGYFLASMTGNLGLILAQDAVSFYLFFALMSFAAYGLVVHERSAEALRAGKVYMVLVVIGEVALFAAMILATAAAESTSLETIRQALTQADARDSIMLLAFVGFGIKAGVLGLHIWLPLAHPVAPTPASAVLSGAMIKAGLLGWLRLLPLGEMALPQWGQIFIFLGLAAAFYAVIAGLMQRAPKTLLAYSSISQMGIMTMCVGLGMSAPEAYPAILFMITLYAVHHGLNKGALFLGVGLVAACNSVQKRWVWLGLCLPAFALAGAPLTSGMLVKLLLKGQTINAPEPWVTALPTILTLSSIATTLLVCRFLYLLTLPGTQATSNHTLFAGLVWPWVILVLATILLPWWFAPETTTLLSQSNLLSSLWPVLFGVTLAFIGVYLSRKRRAVQTRVEGESISKPLASVFPTRLPKSFSNSLSEVRILRRHWPGLHLPNLQHARLSLLLRLRRDLHWRQNVRRAEIRLNRWSTALIAFVLIALLTAGLATSS